MASAKEKVIFVCADCGGEYLAWQGKCDQCGVWNSLREFKQPTTSNKQPATNYQPQVTTLSGVNLQKTRASSKIGEFDRVLGGGLVPGSVTLLAGEPGQGKSTLLLALADNINGTLYVSGEESAEQVGLRAYRLGVSAAKINFLAATDIESILDAAQKQHFNLIIIDSIQTMTVADLPSSAGSILQVKESALRLQRFAKECKTAIVLVGHVTKDGVVAGPRTLEHLVDTVLYLEGDPYHGTRILRGVKNRFGPTDEIGIFTMSDKGLQEVVNPSELFLAERVEGVPGSVVTATIEGSRPLVVEVQALSSASPFGYPKRVATGVDANRVQLIAAVLDKRAGINLKDQDIYVNVVGGVLVKEPACDLAVALAIASAAKAKPVAGKLCVFGEVGLTGEVRRVPHADKRSAEAKRLGFEVYQAAKTLTATLKDIFL